MVILTLKVCFFPLLSLPSFLLHPSHPACPLRLLSFRFSPHSFHIFTYASLLCYPPLPPHRYLYCFFIDCPNNCAVCNDTASCITCTHPYVNYQGACVNFCPFGDNINGTCVGMSIILFSLLFLFPFLSLLSFLSDSPSPLPLCAPANYDGMLSKIELGPFSDDMVIVSNYHTS